MKKARQIIDQHLQTVNAISDEILVILENVADLIKRAHQLGNKVILFGNGGSAADAQHIAAEFVVKFQKERKSLPAIALTTDTSILTAIGNNLGFEYIFSRQLESIAKNGDVVIGISTSGESQNILYGIRTANGLGCKTVGFSGGGENSLSKAVDINLLVPSTVTARIQEVHILYGHILCDLVE